MRFVFNLVVICSIAILLSACDFSSEDNDTITGPPCGGTCNDDPRYMIIFSNLLACDHGSYTYEFTAIQQNAGIPQTVTYDFGDGRSAIALSPPFTVTHTYNDCGPQIGSNNTEPEGWQVTVSGFYADEDTVNGNTSVTPCAVCS